MYGWDRERSTNLDFFGSSKSVSLKNTVPNIPVPCPAAANALSMICTSLFACKRRICKQTIERYSQIVMLIFLPGSAICTAIGTGITPLVQPTRILVLPAVRWTKTNLISC